MKSAGVLGAALGALLGLALALGFGVLLFGFEGDSFLFDSDELPLLYLLAAVLGVALGAVTGLVSALSGAAVARRTSGGATARRNMGALGAAGASVVPVLLLGLLGPFVIVIMLVVAAVSGVIAWLLLPRVVDLETSRVTGREQALPAQYGEAPRTAPAPMPTAKRVVIALLSAGLGGFLATNVIMSLLNIGMARETQEVIAIIVLVVSAGAIGTAVWRGTGRRAR